MAAVRPAGPEPMITNFSILESIQVQDTGFWCLKQELPDVQGVALGEAGGFGEAGFGEGDFTVPDFVATFGLADADAEAEGLGSRVGVTDGEGEMEGATTTSGDGVG